MQTHKDLQVWKEGIDLVVMVYEFTKKFPKSELFGLTSQMRRASISIPSNIAEGAARHSKKEYARFLYISLASISELETQNILSQKLGYAQTDSMAEPITRLRQKLLNFIKFVKTDRFRTGL